jgi:integrase
MPELRRKPDGRFFIDYTLEGKRTRVAVEPPAGGSKDFVRDPEYAREFYDVWLAHKWPELQQGPPASGRLDTVQELVAWYLDDYLSGRNRASSVKAKRYYLEDFAAFCKKMGVGGVRGLSSAVVESYRVDCIAKGMGLHGIANALAYLKIAVHAAESLALIDPLPTRTWPKQAVPRSPRIILTPEQVGAFVATARETEPEYANALTFLALTGMRPSDVVGLEWGDVQGQVLSRVQAKTGKPLVRGLSGPLLDILDAERQKGRRGHKVFARGNGRPLRQDTLFTKFKEVCEAAGLPEGTNPRNMRHSLATNLARKQVAWNTIAQLLGHANPATTFKFYQHMTLADADAAADRYETDILAPAPIKAPTGTSNVVAFERQRVTKR